MKLPHYNKLSIKNVSGALCYAFYILYGLVYFFRYCNVVWQRYIINLKNQSMKREIFARIINMVSEETQLSRESILSKNMFSEVVDARHLP